MIISFNFCFLFSRLQLSSVHLIFRTKQEFFFSTNQTKIIWLQRSNELNEAPAMIEVFIIRIINDHHHYISSFSILNEEYTHTRTHNFLLSFIIIVIIFENECLLLIGSLLIHSSSICTNTHTHTHT